MNSTYGTSFSLDDLVINKGYADGRYLRSAGAPMSQDKFRVRPELQMHQVTHLQFQVIPNGNLVVSGGHGFSTTLQMVLLTNIIPTGTDAPGLTTGTIIT